ncbi:amino acid adenylation domain-containing protein [Zhouia spongiae]|uniref:Amino acid adenylation domain-containing protein n=1 Tax=Zhouia spongiae TaxID=2202721 RepID=A0ABY3YKU9_9FLAO|nr:non-ribosomal peptide synthetase/type I polyketide synthase [Zhouia spongiae]UNY98318.1 amino acid adenylation domain-containing protein [Zhouia spongiae]
MSLKFFKLTKEQEGLWLDYCIDPKSSDYNAGFFVKIMGDLNVENFIRSDYAVKNHFYTVGRLRFKVLDGIPYQYIVGEPDSNHFEYIDLTKEKVSKSSPESILIEKSQKPFKLELEGSVRSILIRYSPNIFFYGYIQHHILTDGVTADLYCKGLSLAYNYGEDSLNDKFPQIQLNDYVCNSNSNFSSISYWKNKLNNANVKLDFGTTQLNLNLDTRGVFKFLFEEKYTSAIKIAARTYRTTPFLFMKTVFGILLYKYWKQKEVIVNYGFNARKGKLHNNTGNFVKILPFLFNLNDELSIKELIYNVNDQRKKDLKNTNISYLDIIDILNANKRNRTRKANISFSQTRFEFESLNLNNCDVETIGSLGLDTGDDINFVYDPFSNGFISAIYFNEKLFNEDFIRQIVRYYKYLVLTIANNVKLKIKDLESVTDDEKRMIIGEWNDTQVDYPKEKCIHQLFEDQSEKTPDNVAVVFEGDSLTYRELNERSNQLAYYLQSKGVKAESLVGICVERSLEMIVGLLGILKAGGAYVPIDPTYPEERISYMFKDTNCAIVLTQEQIELPKTNSEIIYLDSEWEKIAKAPRTNIETGVKGNNLAYVIYTSGSTGNPKGVMVEHESVQNLIQWHTSKFKVSEKSNSTQLANIAFDASIWEIWPYLTCGASLYIVKKESLLDTKKVLNFLDANDVSHCFMPTAIAETILSQSWIENTSLTYLLIGGDRFKTKGLNIDKFSFKLINNYGPTENTVVSTSYEINDSKLSSLIGTPISNVRVYILDKTQKSVPIGVVGELCISGNGLARGYLNQPDLTRKKFIKDPFSKDPNSRLYKTGDLARYLPDGNIEFIGRLDDQVKIRGFRIELGEIESVLNQQDQVSLGVVLAKEDATGNKQLVGYVVPSQDVDASQGLKIEKLREALSKTLPDYMVPSLFVSLEAMPLTSNGKIDKKALPDPQGNLQMTNEYVPPKTEIEKNLAIIWQELLGVEKVGINDNFFELGGHSLIATQVLLRIRKDLKLELPLKVFIDSPTIAKLCDKLVDFNTNIEQLPELVFNDEDKYKPFPLTAVQQSYWIGRSKLYDLGGIGTHAYSEFYLEELDIKRLNEVINYMIKRHDMLRMVVTEDGQQRILEKVEPYEIQIHDFRGTTQEEEKQLFLLLRDKLSHQLFSGHEWPLFDISVCIFRDGTYKLLSSIDGLIFDASSYGIFMKEILSFYKDISFNPPKLALSFRDYVIAEQSLKSTKLYNDSKQYWLDRINEIPKAPELPLAKLPSEIGNVKFRKQRFELSSLKWGILKDVISSAGVTPTVFIIQCFAEIMHRWNKLEHFTLNLTLFNRLPFHEEVNRIIGDFTSLNLLEIDYRKPKDFKSRLKDTQFQLWSDLENRHFNGIEVQRKLSQSTGYTVTMPIVVTSTLGIDLNEDGLSQLERSSHEKVLYDIKHSYAITQTPQVWIDCKIIEKNGGLQIDWDSVKELFPEGMLEDMFGAFERLLTGFIEDKDLWDSRQIELLPRHQVSIQSEANNSTKEYPNKLIHEPFIEQVRIRGEKAAIRTSTKTISYLELYQKSVEVGEELKYRGAKPNHLIAIIMDKGWEQVVTAMGVQFSGAAYMPIDASLPKQRILHLLEIGEVSIVVSLSSILDDLSLPNSIQTLIFDEMQFENRAKVKNIANQGVEDLAYVIFTSGSSGEPKGVMIDHQGAVNTILDINSRFGITEEDSCFAISSLSFDLSVYDVFGILSAGGTIVIPKSSEQKDPKAWESYIEKENITIWNSVPAQLQMLVEYNGGNNKLSSLRKVLLSGDWIPVNLPDRIKDLCPGVEVISLGGATEASIWSIYYPIGQVGADWKSIPYGKPLANQSFYVLKPDLTVCPQWVPGDLYIGGKGLALGYWRDKKKTVSSFIIHPENGERLYRTGDVGRYLSDGNIEFLGRLDDQVKIRGFRIELGEIESVLNQQDQVSSSVVLAKEDASGNKQLVGYVVPSQDVEPSQGLKIDKLREALSKTLPDYMVPSLFVSLEAMPLTSNGKIDKKALSELKEETNDGYIAPSNDLEDRIVELWSDVLGVNKSVISINKSFFELGGNSLLIIKLKNGLSNFLEFKNITIPELFKNHTIKRLVESVNPERLTEYKLQRNIQTDSHEVAIIGMSGAFSGVDNVTEFWDLIKNQDEGVRSYSREECEKLGSDLLLFEDPDYIPVSGHVKDIDQFDPLFWDISPNEAKLIDPQIRKFIEHCWFVLESSGYIHLRKEANIGVFAGSGNNNYFYDNILNGKQASEINLWEAANSSTKDALATMTSYRLDLSGPSNSINTACSTGLVSVVEACKSLQLGTCEMALAGGVTFVKPNQIGYTYQEGMVLSKDGHCRTFDETASGSVESSGVGVVLLKRLEDAIKDEDNIIGVIKGYASNNDGARKTGFTAPSVAGQAECIINAQRMAGVSSDQIGYVECHGTATNLGDPIEVQALKEAFEFNSLKERGSKPGHKTVLGAVKANIGHSKTAAGTAGLIKACLMLQNDIIPGQPNFNVPNPKLNLDQTNFEIVKQNRSWGSSLYDQRIIGVSSFGVGGTNAHVVIGDYLPGIKSESESKTTNLPSKKGDNEFVNYVVPISAKSKESLEFYKQELIKLLGEAHEDLRIEDLAFTLQEKREHYNYRSAYCGKDIKELLNNLQQYGSTKRINTEQKNKIVFMFPGQGSQYPCMGKELYDNDPYFKASIDKLIALANEHLEVDLYDVMYPELGNEQYDINETRWAQISIFIIEYAFAEYIEKLGIRADGYIGHSLGEYVAATLSGVFSLEDAIKVVIARGELMQSMELGSMLAVNTQEESIRTIVETHECEIAAINSIEDIVVTGSDTNINTLKLFLDEHSISSVVLNTSHAYHSRMMEEASIKFERVFDTIELNTPTKYFATNLNGEIAKEEVSKVSYWSDQLRNAVQFSKGIHSLSEYFNNKVNFIEVGLGKGLSSFVDKYKRNNSKKTIHTVHLLPSKKENTQTIKKLNNKEDILAKFWTLGIVEKPNDLKLFKHANKLTSLPTYQFNNKTCWLEMGSPQVVKKYNSIEEIYYERSWERIKIPSTIGGVEDLRHKNILILVNEKDRNKSNVLDLINNLKKYCDHIDYVVDQQSNKIISDLRFDMGDASHIDKVLNEKTRNKPLDLVIYISSTVDIDNPCLDILAIRNTFDWALKTHNRIPKFISVTYDNYEVIGNEVLEEKPSIVSGVTKSIPFEYFSMDTTAYHVDLSSIGLVYNEALISTILGNKEKEIIAVRGKYKWIPKYQQVAFSKENFLDKKSSRSNNPVFMITGGLGGVGYAYANYLTQKEEKCTIILLGRTKKSNLKEEYKTRLNNLIETGHKIIYESIDIGLIDAVGSIEKILENNGINTIEMVLHSAGVAAKSAINDKTNKDIVQVVRPKVLGVEHLLNLAESIKINYLVSCSSLSSVMPSLGQMEYTAANMYLDELSYRSHTNINCILAVNLNQISDTGMAVDFIKENSSSTEKSSNSIKSHQFPAVLDVLLQAKTIHNILLSRQDLNELLSENTNLLTEINRKAENVSNVKIKEEEYSETEYRVAQIWHQVLGVEEIGLHDNFFELGGHSLHVMQVISKIRTEFNNELPLKVLFDGINIKEIARIVLSDKTNSEIKQIEKVQIQKFKQMISNYNEDNLLNEIDI